MTRTIFNILIASVAAIAAHADGTDLIEAARTNDVAQVKVLLERGVDPESRDESGHTALHFAAGYGYAEVAQTLVDHGADVDAVGNIGNTPLLIAAQEGHTEVARILVDNGANIDAEDEFGGTSTRYAAGRGHRDVVDILRGAEVSGQSAVAGISPVVAAALAAVIAVPVLGARLVAAVA